MLSFKGWKSEYLEEAGIVNMERYIRAHGKRPKSDGGPANYMFCSKRFGEPDHNDAKQVFAINATWNDAKKAVSKWAKENKLSSVYMMEEQNPENAEAEASNRKKQTGKNGKAGLPAGKNTAKSGQNAENAEAEAANRKKQAGKGASKVGIKSEGKKMSATDMKLAKMIKAEQDKWGKDASIKVKQGAMKLWSRYGDGWENQVQ